MAKKLTNFLIALNDSMKLRDKYRDPVKRAKLLEQWDLEGEPALQEGASFDDIASAVARESGSKQVDLWIRSAGTGPLETERNPEYDPIA
jgi:hypothetical protein